MDQTQTLVVVILLLLGMDYITSVHPTIHQFYRWILRIVLFRPLRWILHQIRRGAVWLILWCGRQIWHFVRFLGRQLGRGTLWTLRQIRQRLPPVVWVVICLLLATVVVRSTSSLLGNIEWSKVGLNVVMITVGILLLVWLLIRIARRGAGIRAWFPPRWAVITILIVAAIYGPTTWFAWLDYSSKSAKIRGRPTSSFAHLPADVVLPIIAQCESGGRQFDDRGYLIKNPTSSAVGKYQIMASLHEARARSLGHNIRTLEGNEGYARYLYAESGTQHWEVDPRSRRCWEPKLVALGKGAVPPIPPVVASTPSQEIATPQTRMTASNFRQLRRNRQKQTEALALDAKYCWVTTRGPRSRRSDPVVIYNSVSPTESSNFEGRRGKKLVCVW